MKTAVSYIFNWNDSENSTSRKTSCIVFLASGSKHGKRMNLSTMLLMFK